MEVDENRSNLFTTKTAEDLVVTITSSKAKKTFKFDEYDFDYECDVSLQPNLQQKLAKSLSADPISTVLRFTKRTAKDLVVNFTSLKTNKSYS